MHHVNRLLATVATLALLVSVSPSWQAQRAAQGEVAVTPSNWHCC